MRLLRVLRPAAALALAATLVTACGDDGPTYPSVFAPAELQGDLGSASAALGAPATESFSFVGFDIDLALAALGGGGAVLELPALLLEAESAIPSTRVAARVRSMVGAEARTASAIPAPALGKTFEFDPLTDTYEMGERTGAPANGVRFVLYAIDPVTERPAEPLVETGYVDLTRTATNSSATARVQVFGGGANLVKALDYSATIDGTVTAPTVRVAGFARNAADSLGFSLTTSVSLAAQAVTLDWRTALASRGLVSRIRQTIGSGPADETQFTIDAFIQSPNGRVDLDGTINELTGGSIATKVNGRTYATMTLTTGEDELPTIVNAAGQPLNAEEEEVLQQIFTWFAQAFLVYLSLLAPVGTLLDAAF